MSVPSSVEELLQLIRKSGMVDDQKLTGYLQRRNLGRGLPDDPREACDAMVRDAVLTNFQAEQFLLGKWRGFTIGKYKLLERIGVGGMGQVFLCEHMFMKRRVAIKVLPPAKAEQPAALGRFYREARAAGSLEHPNIVRTHDIDQDGNLHFIVMEYVDGCNLLDAVKKFGAMDLGRAVSYVHQVANSLDFAFRSGIIHRDVKPGNILIDRRGRARILDMGLARFYKDQNDLLTVKYDDKIVLGTADYVAPEQVANSHAVDIRADVYGLGATLYFLLAGHPPFPTGTVSQKLLWHRTKEPTPIRQLRPEVPEGLATIVATMMAKDPKNRYQTPADLAAALLPWVPAQVMLPAAEEMPQLCPAVVEGTEASDSGAAQIDTLEMVSGGTNEPSGELVGSRGTVAVGAAAPGSGSRTFPTVNPFGPVSASPTYSPAPGRDSRPLGGGSRPSVNPFGPVYPPASPTVTPEPSPARRSSFASKLPFQQEAETLPASSQTYKLALVAILTISVLLGAAVVYFAFLAPSASNPNFTRPGQPATTGK
jgi:eukaryotic-like serine/threonine-protein kinase